MEKKLRERERRFVGGREKNGQKCVCVWEREREREREREDWPYKRWKNTEDGERHKIDDDKSMKLRTVKVKKLWNKLWDSLMLNIAKDEICFFLSERQFFAESLLWKKRKNSAHGQTFFQQKKYWSFFPLHPSTLYIEKDKCVLKKNKPVFISYIQVQYLINPFIH